MNTCNNVLSTANILGGVILQRRKIRVAQVEKKGGVPKVSFHPLVTKNACTTFQNNSSNIYWDISLWAKVVDQLADRHIDRLKFPSLEPHRSPTKKGQKPQGSQLKERCCIGIIGNYKAISKKKIT